MDYQLLSKVRQHLLDASISGLTAGVIRVVLDDITSPFPGQSTVNVAVFPGDETLVDQEQYALTRRSICITLFRLRQAEPSVDGATYLQAQLTMEQEIVACMRNFNLDQDTASPLVYSGKTRLSLRSENRQLYNKTRLTFTYTTVD